MIVVSQAMKYDGFDQDQEVQFISIPNLATFSRYDCSDKKAVKLWSYMDVFDTFHYNLV